MLFLICLWAFFVVIIISILINPLTGKCFGENLSLQLCCENIVTASMLKYSSAINYIAIENVHHRVLF